LQARIRIGGADNFWANGSLSESRGGAMKRRSKVMVALLVSMLVVVGLCVNCFAANDIKIGYTAPFTGSAAEFGTNGWRGVQIALDEINQKGVMVNGKKHTVEVIRYDSICTPTDGAANIRKLIMQDKVVAVLGDHCSSVCNAIAPLCEQFQVPGITIECAADNVTNPGHDYYFRMRASVGLMAPLFTPSIVKAFNPKSAGFLVINDDYGLGQAAAVADEFKRLGVKTNAQEVFERGNTDFSVNLLKLKKADVDVVFYVGSASEGAMILKQANEMELTEKVKFVGSEEMGEMELLSLAGKQAIEGTYAVGLWGEVPADFAKLVKKLFDAPMHYAIIFGYDALHTVVRAIESAQSIKPNKIRDALAKTDYQGLAGPIKFYNFDGYRNQGKAEPSLIQWKNGQRITIK
jgi:branched-chain amino acid transport system substrate-binding protein